MRFHEPETGAIQDLPPLPPLTHTGNKPQPTPVRQPGAGRPPSQDSRDADPRTWQAERCLVLWNARRLMITATAAAVLFFSLVSFLIPPSFTSTTQLMPPDSQSASGIAMISALAKAGGGLGSMTGDLLGLKSTGALFVGMLRSESAQASLVEQFDLKHVYGVQLLQDARARLDQRTVISEDRKSGLITISVSDVSAPRAAALANAYVDRLNALVTDSSTSSAHRERVFLEDRLKVAKEDLDRASHELAQFSSQNSTLDIQQMGKAMLDSAGNIAAQLIAAQSELQGLRQMYTDDNARVQSLSGRVAELRKQLGRIEGEAGNTAVWDAGASPPAARPGQTDDLPYPSMRSLPLLGVKYADYYRHSKIQEAVYELLTEQYELAKIQEVKETPSVKVLDRARIPERRSFPPRTLIVVVGTFLAFTGSVLWVAAGSCWRAADPQDPRKVLAEEAVNALRARIPWASTRHATSD